MTQPKQNPAAQTYYFNSVKKAIDHISANLDQPLNLEQLAETAGFSPWYFHRIFSAITGETPQDYVKRLRLELSASLLVKSPALSISEIAYQCGFSSPSNFARDFKAFFGVTAREYTRTQQTRQQPPAWTAFRLARDYSVEEPLPDVKIVHMPAFHLACFSTLKGYAPQEVGRTWQKLFRWAEARSLLEGDHTLIAISFDDPLITEKQKCRFSAGISVPPEMKQDTQASFYDIPEHLTAVYSFAGKPEEIQPAYQIFYRDWLPQSGFLPANYPYEILRREPTPPPDVNYFLDICIPVNPL